MADLITTPEKSGKAGVRKSKKLSTKVDLTPMVDLGFLLITFFMISTKWAEPKAAELMMPADGSPTSICESCALTLIPTGGNKIFFYHGGLENAIKTGQLGITSFSLTNGIGDIIREKQKSSIRQE